MIKANTQSLYKVAAAILKNDDDTADAISETILICWEKLDELRQEQYFKTWLIRILINQCNAIYRQHKQVEPFEIVPDEAVDDPAYERVEWLDLLAKLNKPHREAVILYYAEGFKVREIADILGVSESTVKKRLVNARQQVRGYYNNGKELGVI